jgi:hypothetical protein
VSQNTYEYPFRIIPSAPTYSALVAAANAAGRHPVDEAGRRILGILGVPVDRGRPANWKRPRSLIAQRWEGYPGQWLESASLLIVLTQEGYEVLVRSAVKNDRPIRMHLERVLRVSLKQHLRASFD